MAIPNTTFRAYVEKLGATEAATFIGNEGDLFYDPNTASLRVSDGVTPGGVPVAGVTTITGPIQQSLIPDQNATYDLGSPTNEWRDLYLTNNTIFLGGTPVGLDTSNHLTVDGNSIPTTEEVQQISTGEAAATTLVVNTDRRIYHEGVAGIENPNPNSGGWYYRTGNGDFIRWNFWSPKPNADGGNTLADLEGGWVLFTPWSSDTRYPYIQMYTLPKLGGGNAQSWYRSRITYNLPDETHTPGTPLLLWFGNTEPDVFPGVPRRQMTIDPVSTEGPVDADEVIFSHYVASSTGVFDGAYDFSAGAVGVKMGSQDYKYVLYAVPLPETVYKLNATDLRIESSLALKGASGEYNTFSRFFQTKVDALNAVADGSYVPDPTRTNAVLVLGIGIMIYSFDIMDFVVIAELAATGNQATKYIDLDGIDSHITFGGRNGGSAAAMDWSQSWSLGITLVGLLPASDNAFMSLFSSGTNQVMLRRGGTNWGLYVTANDNGYQHGANTWVAPTDTDRILLTYDAATNRLKYYLGNPATGVYAMRANLAVNSTVTSANNPGAELNVGKGGGGSGGFTIIPWDGGVNNLLVSNTVLTGTQIDEFFQTGEAFTTHEYYPAITSYCRLGEDTFPTVSDEKSNMPGGVYVNGVAGDFKDVPTS